MSAPYKLQVELNPTQLQSLNELQEAGDLRTKKELLDNAFTLLKWAVKQQQEGNVIVSMNSETGAIKELTFPYLQNAKEKYLNMAKQGDKLALSCSTTTVSH